MLPEVLAAAAQEAISLASKLIGEALSSGAITPEQAAAMLANAESEWGDAYAGWKAARGAGNGV